MIYIANGIVECLAICFAVLERELALQAVHDEVPPETLAPTLRQLVDQFVHDRARPEVMTLGLKTVRELCERAPLVMTPELLQASRLVVVGSNWRQ